jgi:aryl-alcohol dehydrogenase-like predicted oxidoreductase
MEQIEIPGITTKASRVALGTWAIGGWMWGGTDDSDAIRTVHAALDLGINLIDTAPAYGFGRSEELIGRALTGGKRERAVIATKVGLNWRDGKVFRDSSSLRLRLSSTRRRRVEPRNALRSLIAVSLARRSVSVTQTFLKLASYSCP